MLPDRVRAQLETERASLVEKRETHLRASAEELAAIDGPLGTIERVLLADDEARKS